MINFPAPIAPFYHTGCRANCRKSKSLYHNVIYMYTPLSLNSAVMQALCDRLQGVMDGLQSEVSDVCRLYSWLDGANSLITRCKKEKTSDISAHTFEVGITRST